MHLPEHAWLTVPRWSAVSPFKSLAAHPT